ncbi:hypothetical protein ACFVYE_38580 [Streptomyces sp. NPDC058239]|uniref:hypothetical protein n=1 Tax=Streptomyces sp. NPDC058239 TaxID=3346395 RepID=UPI0036E04775
MSDLFDRAAAVPGRHSDGIRRPYGLETPGFMERRRDPEGYERHVVETRARQKVMAAWAERYGLRSGSGPLLPAAARCGWGTMRAGAATTAWATATRARGTAHRARIRAG